MGKGGKTFLKKSFSLPSPNPIPPFPKTFVLIESLLPAFPAGEYQCIFSRRGQNPSTDSLSADTAKGQAGAMRQHSLSVENIASSHRQGQPHPSLSKGFRAYRISFASIPRRRISVYLLPPRPNPIYRLPISGCWQRDRLESCGNIHCR